MSQKLSTISDQFLQEATKQWLSSRRCVYVGTSAPELLGSNQDASSLVSATTAQGKWLLGIHPLEWDSKHFGIKMAKLLPFILPDIEPHDVNATNFARGLVQDLLHKSKEMGIAHLTALVHPEDSVGQTLLSEVGFQLLDTTVLYQLDLATKASHSSHLADSDYRVREANNDTKEIDRLQSIAQTCFGSRSHNINRFNSDPHLEPSRATALYQEWLTNSLNGTLANKIFVIEYKGEPAGFATLQFDSQERVAQIPLNAIDPQFRGLGLYSSLVDFCISWLIKNQFEKLEIWTHISNFPVHNAWQNRGARLKFSAHQFRLYQPQSK